MQVLSFVFLFNLKSISLLETIRMLRGKSEWGMFEMCKEHSFEDLNLKFKLFLMTVRWNVLMVWSLALQLFTLAEQTCSEQKVCEELVPVMCEGPTAC